MKPWATILMLCAALSACASVPSAPPPLLFNDAAFGTPLKTASPAEIFAVSDAMKAYLQDHISYRARNDNPRQALFDALYKKGQLRLEYDAEMTRNATEAFDARAGNCLSLVLMTAALAKELNLAVQYQTVMTEESWSRSGDLYFVSGHVNLTLGKKTNENTGYDARGLLTIDFLPPQDGAGYRSLPIPEQTILAMYMNNRAAETLAARHIEQAYWWARAAILQDPAFGAAYNTLGVIFRRHGNLDDARRSFAFALERSPSDTFILSNLAQSLEALGREPEARVLRERLARLQPEPPFHFFNLAQKAMLAGDYRAAVTLFAREVARDPYYHEFHFGLAQAYFKLGELRLADRELILALENSTTRNDHQLYAAKLQRIRAQQAQVRAQ
ncbi:tetratricopeptide repeat protein [Janthinobacterium agaricidamnosum]|uniref:Tetratricopeptide repeat family protein n=1 Tax=Janthinobacterium agaricidamnosum NBRC 102515 = DSM 9628 TaxID=1349767 RepID=W0V3T9_9BURK|nr:tetratricopeptide repeat protein [Janthinobacterium agaricidamnosum]CDG81927.1 tetratricopeptide repeat family protein [Janthinobacterium agaricidamnosum NBRC 102515 = DSM 9628]